MKLRGLIIAVVVLLALGGLLYWSNHRKPPETAAASLSNTSAAMLKMDRASINELTIAPKGATPITLQKASGDSWRIIKPKVLTADQETVSGILSTVSNLDADRVVEDKPADLKQYGLDSPAVAVDITSKNQGQRKLLLGDDTPAGSDVYAMIQGDPKVYTIPAYNKTSIDKTLADLRNKKLFDFGFGNPDKIDLHQGTKSWSFSRSGTDWVSNGKKMDSSGVQSLIEKLRDLTASGFPDSGFAAPSLEVTVSSDDGKRVETVLMSKSGHGYIARRKTDPELYLVDAASVTALTSAADAVKAAPGAPK